MQDIQTEFINLPNGNKIGYKYRASNGPCLVWLCGYHSDMSGTKASMMDRFAYDMGISSLRFDYSGTGVSSGNFEDGTISKWLDDAKAIIAQKTKGEIILVGSSMGGWIALLLSQIFKPRIKAMVLIAPAPDFTQDLMWNKFSKEIQNEMKAKGYYLRASDYDENGYKITLDLIEDGRKNLVLGAPIDINIPIRILHGKLDADVPFARSIDLMETLKSDDVQLTLVKNGDHRLSNDDNLNLLYETIKGLGFVNKA